MVGIEQILLVYVWKVVSQINGIMQEHVKIVKQVVLVVLVPV